MGSQNFRGSSLQANLKQTTMISSSKFALALSLMIPSVASLQPEVITVEAYPSRRVFGSLSMPEGSPWCDGLPTFWLVGHQGDDETPWCLSNPVNGTSSFANYNYSGALFERPRNAVLDQQDPLNVLDGPNNIDRHGCTAIDVNNDGVEDIVCGVGANKGQGNGFNELYLTSSNGNVTKVLDGHGLHKYTTVRTRHVVNLERADGAKLVFIAARGAPRLDDQPNNHRMYRLVHGKEAKYFTNHSFYFREEPVHIWKRNTKASCLLKADLNNDGLDDLLICNEVGRSAMFVQHADNSWSELPTPGPNTKNWGNARVVDVTGDGFPDIVVVGRGQPSYVKVFEGKPTYPHYAFNRKPYFEMTFPFAAPDVEVLDVNDDGRPDLYVVQVDQTRSKDNYCSHMSSTIDFYGKRGPRASDSFAPPLDLAKDVLLVGNKAGSFDNHTMDFAEPGCGSRVQRFGGGKTMILAQGSQDRSGHNLLLQW